MKVKFFPIKQQEKILESMKNYHVIDYYKKLDKKVKK